MDSTRRGHAAMCFNRHVSKRRGLFDEAVHVFTVIAKAGMSRRPTAPRFLGVLVDYRGREHADPYLNVDGRHLLTPSLTCGNSLSLAICLCQSSPTNLWYFR